MLLTRWIVSCSVEQSGGRETMKINRADSPEWMQELLGLVQGAMAHESPTGSPLGYVWVEPQGDEEEEKPWRICIFPTPGEVLEMGPDDGKVIIPGFKFDLKTIIAGFDRLSEIEWYAPSDYRGELDGPCLCFCGSWKKKPVIMCLFDEPPQIFEPTVVYDCIRGETRLIKRVNEETEGWNPDNDPDS